MAVIDERRGRILTAAQEVFAEHGFRSADVKTIAVQAGVGKATIYKFFDSKEALLLTIVEENLNHIRDIVLKHLISNKRSEEHTSELQSRPHLVCRLLLEKKK